MAESTVRTQYDQLAILYDQRWHSYVTRTLSFLHTWARIPAQASVLDVACGTGEFERQLLAPHPTQSIVGVDISAQMLAIAQQKYATYSNVSFHLGRAAALPFADTSFDSIVCANAFHYFDNPADVLQEMKRVLKPEGTMVILDWCKDYLLCRLCDLGLQLFDPAHKHCYTQAALHHILVDSGFTLQRATRIRFGLVWGLMAVTVTRASSKILKKVA